MFNKKIDTKATIHDLIASRWSGRTFDPDRLLSREQIIALIEAARWAPSCYGDQPWRYIIFDKATNLTGWEKALSCLVEGNREWAKNAPLLLLACSDSILSQNGKPNRWSGYDTGAASLNLSLQATAMGLMVHQMGGYDVDKTQELFNIPEQFTSMAMIAVGYQLSEDKISEELKEREYGLRNRNPLEQHFFEGSWEQPVNIKI